MDAAWMQHGEKTMAMLRALKPHRYKTRYMVAGDEYEVLDRPKARLYKALGWAEDADVRSGPAPKVEVRPEYDDEREDELENMTQPELLELATKRGVDLPSGYVTKPKLLALLSKTERD
jgi:hypothetical protein